MRRKSKKLEEELEAIRRQAEVEQEEVKIERKNIQKLYASTTIN